ncbi:MAG: hypothetical protein ACOH2H_00730 [Cypionkella sp.]
MPPGIRFAIWAKAAEVDHLDPTSADREDMPPERVIGGVQCRTDSFACRKSFALRLRDISLNPALTLARNGATLARPQSEHESNVLFSQIHDIPPLMSHLEAFLIRRLRLL